MRKSILAVAVAAATVVSGANAAGLYLKEQSVVGQGRAFAGSAAGTDGASAAYFNPAGIVELEEQIEVGVHLIAPDVTVTNNGTPAASQFNPFPGTVSPIEPYSAKPVPNAHYVKPIDETLAMGIAIGAPFGFSNDYGDSAFNRADNVKVDLSVIELSTSLAKRVTDKLSLSGGLVYQTLDVEQVFGTGAVGTTTTLKADGSALGFVIGAQYEITPETTLGFSHRSQNTVEVKGSLSDGAYALTPGGAGLKADFELPSITSLGVKVSLSDSTRGYADVTHYGWSAYEKLVAVGTGTAQKATGGTPRVTGPGDVLETVQNNYRDTVSFGLGAEHDYGDGLTVRAGIHIDPTPTNDTDRSTSTPDSDRTWLATGFSKAVSDQLTIDGAFTHIIADDGNINKTTLSGSVVNAKVKSSVNILSLGLRYKF